MLLIVEKFVSFYGPIKIFKSPHSLKVKEEEKVIITWIGRHGVMSCSGTGVPHYHAHCIAQLGLQDKGQAIKELVVLRA